jgi:Fe-S-cluster containining protein
MIESSPSRKEAIWLACREKSCCYNAVVVPTGRDVWRIARALDAPPWTFLTYFPSRGARRDAFALDRSGDTFRLALAKGRSRRTKSPPPCIFLMRTRAGYHRCGLGDLRPGACRAFPVEAVEGVLCLRPDAGCTCRQWSLADVEIAEEWPLIAALQEEGEEYCRVVARWNERVRAAPEDAEFGFRDYCAYLLEAYDTLPGIPGRAP